MKVFVTGATGYVGAAIVRELLRNGHEVLGLTRSKASAETLRELGGAPFEGDLGELDRLAQGARECDAVIHLGFNHDFSRFEKSCADDAEVVRAIGAALKGSARPFVVTSGIAVLAGMGATLDETVNPPRTGQAHPRAQTELAATEVSESGVKVSVVRLSPSVHGAGDKGFVKFVADFAQKNGVSAYVGDGANCWPAVHRDDAAELYRLALEAAGDGVTYHAVAEQGVTFRAIAEALGHRMGLPAVSLAAEDAAAHFEWFAPMAALDLRSDSARTRKALGWQPSGPTLLEDIAGGAYDG